MKWLILFFPLAAFVGGTVHERTEEVCDVNKETFIGIPYSSKNECATGSLSGGTSGPPVIIVD
jgi:hypothetical protein